MNRSAVALVLVFFSFIVGIGEDEKKLLPSEVNAKVHSETSVQYQEYLKQHKENPDLTFDYEKTRQALAEKYLDDVRTNGLNQNENLELANLLSTAGKQGKALVLYTQLDTGNGVVAYRASLARLGALLEEENYPSAEAMIAEHQARFTPSPETSGMLLFVIESLAGSYAENGNHAKAVELVLAEVGRVPGTLDAAYFSPNLLSYLADSFITLGRKEELFSLMEDFAAKYEAAYESRKNEIPKGDSPKVRKAHYEIRAFNDTARRLRSKITRVRMLGMPAPGFTFTHFYNTKPITLAGLKGKVVMVDFWANWCGPCKRAFPSMRKLYDEYKDEGFVILGVTGLQGRFSDGDVRKAGVEPAEELELTEELLKRYEVTWPVAFSDRGPNDPEYGVTGIPTFVVIDKKGVIRFVGVGATEANENKLKELVPRLLAESE